MQKVAGIQTAALAILYSIGTATGGSQAEKGNSNPKGFPSWPLEKGRK